MHTANSVKFIRGLLSPSPKRVILGMGIFLQVLWYFPAFAEGPFHEARTTHYRVFSEISTSHAQELGAYLEQLYSIYNSFFQFPEPVEGRPLTVRIFQNQGTFTAYLSRFLRERREDFVYLHHPDPFRRELLVYQTSPDLFYPALNHQALLQFLRSFVQHPPLWLREGFAVFFERVAVDPTTQRLQFIENTAWVDLLKERLNPALRPDERRMLPLNQFLFLTPPEARKDLLTFIPQAWGFVTFLLQAEDRSYQRFLWDTLSILQEEASLQENYQRIQEQILPWYDLSNMEAAFKTYFNNRPTYASLMRRGIAAYEKGEYTEAEEAFRKAAALDAAQPLAHYYLGLLAYARKDFAKAQEHYLRALALGGQRGLIQYALGINAFAWNRPTEARAFLSTAIEADPSFKEKAEPLLKRLQR